MKQSERELRRLLQSIGMKFFVEFYNKFADSGLTNAEIVDMLPSYLERTARETRVRKARQIIDRGWTREAIELIAEARRVDPSAARRARYLLERL